VLLVDGSSGSPPGIVVGGQFDVSLTIGHQLPFGGNKDAFVAKFDDLGNPIWAQSFGDSVQQSFARVVADKAGDLLIAIRGNGAFTMGPACPVGGPPDSDLWIAKLRGGDGTCVWAQGLPVGPSLGPMLGSPGSFGLSYDPAHDVGVITGDTNGSSYFDGVNGQSEVFVDTFADSDGSRAWLQPVLFGPIGMEATPTGRWGEQVRVSPCGDIFVAGNFEKDISIPGAGSYTNDHYSATVVSQLFLAKLSAENGAVAWAKPFPSDGAELVHGLAVGPGGEIAIAGEVTDEPGSQGIDFDGVLLAKAAGAPGDATNAFVAAFVDGPGGPSYLFGTRLYDGSTNMKPSQAWDLAAGDTGGLAVTGTFDSAIRFSTQPGATGSSNSYGAFFASYDQH
jgi:hypothetical protein